MNLKVFNKKEFLMIIACFIGIGICYGIQYSFSLFFVEINNYFNTNKSTSSLIFSISLLVYGLYSPIIGVITNRYGGRKVFKIASFIILLGFTLSYFTTSIPQLYFTLGVITAIGINSVGFVPVAIIISNNFPQRKGLALGLATTGVGAGAFIISIFVKFMIDILGWKIALGVLGCFSSFIIFSISYFLPQLPKVRTFNFDFSIFKDKNFWLIQAGMSFGAMTTQGIMLHIVSLFIEKGSPKFLSAITISIIALTGSIGKIFWGFLSDKIKPIKLYIIACIIIIFSLNIILFSKTPILPFYVVLFSILFGIGYGSFAPLFPSLAIEKFQNNFGNIMGLLATGNGVGAFFSTFFIGYLYDISGNYNIAIIFLITLIVLSVTTFSFAFIKK